MVGVGAETSGSETRDDAQQYEEPEDEFLDDLLMVCNCFGVTQEDVETLLEYGYTSEEIEEMLLDDDFLHDTLNEIKALNFQ